MLTDIYLELDRLCNRKVFKPTKTQSRIDLAAIEGCKTKKCLGALRTLWRSSGDRGHNDRVTHLKSLLVPSPRRGRNQFEEGEEPLGALDDDDQGDQREGPENEGSEPEQDPENVGSEAEQESENVGSEAEQESENEKNEGCEEEERKAEEWEFGEEGDDVAATSPDDSSAPSDDVSPPSRESGSHLSSQTLMLDDCHSASEVDSISSEDSMPPDSQVPGAGWMGRAMMAARPLERQEKEEEKKRARINTIVGDIRTELFAQCRGHEDADLDVSWDSYKGFCVDAIHTHGEDVFQKLATMDFFFKWLREEKAKPAQARL